MIFGYSEVLGAQYGMYNNESDALAGIEFFKERYGISDPKLFKEVSCD